MYSQLLYFIVALLLFTIQQPGTQPFLPPLETFLLGLLIFSLYVISCHEAFRRLKNAIRQDPPHAIISLHYHRLQTQLSILALGVLLVYVYVFNIKFYLQRLPGFDESFTLSGIFGLGLYVLHLAVIWFYSHPVYRYIHHSDISRAEFLKGHFAFSSAILIPWFLISFLSDLVQVFEVPGFLKTDAGQLLVLGIALTCFIFFAPWLVVRLWGCRSLPETPVREELEAFCRQNRFKIGDFMLWPLFGGDTLTAGVMGILPGWRYILITRGLLSLLNEDELKAVVAHEIGHVRRYHLIFYLFFFICYSVLTYSFNDIILLFLLKYETILQWALTPDNLHLTLFSIVYSVPVLLLLLIYFRYIFGFFLRNSERQADIYAMQLVGHPFTLISSLQKIALYSGSIEDLPSWHHYSIRQRIEFLLDAHAESSRITKHHQKLYGMALLFLIGVVSLTFLSAQLEHTRVVDHWRKELQVSIIARELQKTPENPELNAAYGGLLLEQGRIAEAESTLNRALEMAPEDPGILNNLAWLYATSPLPHFHPERALELALMAEAIKPEPHVLDTLAEAYYSAGLFEKAVKTIDRALEKQPENRDYYLQQRRKFVNALEGQKEGSGGPFPAGK